MTVEDLIQQLEQLPPTTAVYFLPCGHDDDDAVEIDACELESPPASRPLRIGGHSPRRVFLSD